MWTLFRICVLFYQLFQTSFIASPWFLYSLHEISLKVSIYCYEQQAAVVVFYVVGSLDLNLVIEASSSM